GEIIVDVEPGRARCNEDVRGGSDPGVRVHAAHGQEHGPPPWIARDDRAARGAEVAGEAGRRLPPPHPPAPPQPETAPRRARARPAGTRPPGRRRRSRTAPRAPSGSGSSGSAT